MIKLLCNVWMYTYAMNVILVAYTLRFTYKTGRTSVETNAVKCSV